MSNFRDFKTKNKLKGTCTDSSFIDFGTGDVSKGSLNQLIKNATKSGTLNLTNRQLKEIPKEVYNINCISSKNDKSINLDGDDEGWWDNVFLTKLIVSTNIIKSIENDINLLDKLTYLDLSDNKIDTLPCTICNLVLLRHLNISKNIISDLPINLGKLNVLQQFFCSQNLIEKVPDLSELNVLEWLDISNNNLSRFPPFIGNLQLLRKLELHHNKIASMPIVTKKPQALRFIDLSYNKLENFSDESYLNLEQLYLHVNKLTSFPITCLHTELKELCISNNHIKTLTDVDISNIPNLTTLSIANNSLTELSEKMSDLKILANLDVSNNGLRSLPFSLGNLHNLKSMTITGNQFRAIKRSVLEAGADAIKEYLRTRNTAETEDKNESGICPGMLALGRAGTDSGSTYLDQSDLRATGVVRLTARGLTELSDDIFESLKAVTVKEFILNKNKLTIFPSRIFEYGDTLLDLDISSNQLSSVPSSIDSLRLLRRLNISNNRIDSLPESLANLESLNNLTLSYNPFGAHIPQIVYRCVRLQSLVMSHCGLQSLDPAKIALMPSLEVIDVSNNDIGVVPPELGLCHMIKTLNLEGNSFRVPRLPVLAKGTPSVMEYLRSRIVPVEK